MEYLYQIGRTLQSAKYFDYSVRIIREKYCDYFVFNIVDSVCVNYISVDYLHVDYGLPRSGAHHRALS
jgi:hypothetical protein